MYTSLGVLPLSAWLGLCSLNHARYTVSSRRMASSASGTRIRRVHSFFIERMNRSITAMLPCCWTAPKRGLMPRRWHQFLNESHQNCVPLSEITYLGGAPDLANRSIERSLHFERRRSLHGDGEAHNGA